MAALGFVMTVRKEESANHPVGSDLTDERLTKNFRGHVAQVPPLTNNSEVRGKWLLALRLLFLPCFVNCLPLQMLRNIACPKRTHLSLAWEMTFS